MSVEQLEQRVAAIEKTLNAIQQKVGVVVADVPQKAWWDAGLPPMTPDQQQAFEEAMAYGRYFRQTGQDPPPDWKPGDPIPEPDYGA